MGASPPMESLVEWATTWMTGTSVARSRRLTTSARSHREAFRGKVETTTASKERLRMASFAASTGLALPIAASMTRPTLPKTSLAAAACRAAAVSASPLVQLTRCPAYVTGTTSQNSDSGSSLTNASMAPTSSGESAV